MLPSHQIFKIGITLGNMYKHVVYVCVSMCACMSVFRIWVLQIISPLACVWFVFQGTRGFWSIVNFHTKSAEESRGSTSSGKPVEFSPGTLNARQNVKVHSAQKLTNILPNQTWGSATCSWNFDCAGLCGLSVSLSRLSLELLEIRSGFAWLPLVFKHSHCHYFKQRSTLPLVREKTATTISLVATWCLVQFL